MKFNSRIAEATRAELARACPPSIMRIAEMNFYPGSNPWSPEPVIRYSIEAGEEFDAGLLLTRAGPDILRFASGEEAGEAAAAELLGHAVGSFAVGMLRRVGSEGLTYSLECEAEDQVVVTIEYRSLGPTLQAALVALLRVGGMAAGASDATLFYRRHIRDFDDIVRMERHNKESLVLQAAAREKDIPYLQVAENQALWQFGWGKNSLIFWETASNLDGTPAYLLAKYKDAGKRYFSSLGLPTPRWKVLKKNGDIAAVTREIGWPCVVKPLDRGAGKGVAVNIRNEEHLRRAVEVAREFSDTILVEAHEPGHDHRLMVVDGRLIVAVRRQPPAVTGDGKRNVRALIDAFNAPRLPGGPESFDLKPVRDDDGLVASLASQGVTMKTILPAGQEVLLRGNANHSTGGSIVNVIDMLHPQIRHAAEHLAKSSGLRSTGIDYITRDISRSHGEVGGGFIEFNAAAGLRGLSAAGLNEEALASAVLGDHCGRIPVSLIVAPEAMLQDLFDRLAQELDRLEGAAIAGTNACRTGSFSSMVHWDNPMRYVTMLLQYRTVSSLHILWPAAQLVMHGLPVDRLDRSIVGTGLDDAWMELLRRSSGEVIQTSGLENLVAAALDPRQTRASERRSR